MNDNVELKFPIEDDPILYSPTLFKLIEEPKKVGKYFPLVTLTKSHLRIGKDGDSAYLWVSSTVRDPNHVQDPKMDPVFSESHKNEEYPLELHVYLNNNELIFLRNFINSILETE